MAPPSPCVNCPNLEQMLKNFEEKYNVAQAQNKEMVLILGTCHVDREKFLNTYEIWKDNRERLEAELGAAENENVEVKKLNEDLENEMESIIIWIQGENQANIDTLIGERDEAASRAQKLQEDYAKFEADSTAKQQELTQKVDKLTAELTTRAQQLQQESARSEAESKTKQQELTQQVQQLTAELTEASKKVVSNSSIRKEFEVRESVQYNLHRTEIDGLNNTIKRLETTLAASNVRIQEIDILFGGADGLEQYRLAMSENVRLEGELLKAKQLANQYYDWFHQNSEKVLELTKALDGAKAQMDIQNAYMEVSYDKLAEELEESYSMISELMKNLEQVQKERIPKDSYDRMGSELQDSYSMVSDLLKNLDQVQEELKNIKEQLAQKTQDFESLTVDQQMIRKELEASKSQVIALEQGNAWLVERHQKLVDQLEMDLNETTDGYCRMEEELEQCYGQISALKKDLEESEKLRAEIILINQDQVEFQQITEELEKLKEQLLENCKARLQLSSDNFKIDEKEEEIEVKAQEMNTVIFEMDQDMEALKAEVVQLKKQMEAAATAHEQDTKELNAYRACKTHNDSVLIALKEKQKRTAAEIKIREEIQGPDPKKIKLEIINLDD